MSPHPLANLFQRSNYDEPIASEFCALDYLYEVLLEIRESENCDEALYEAIHDRSLNKKHDCNDFTINSLDFNCANNMQNPKLGDANFDSPLLVAMIMIGVILLMILKIYLSPMMNMRLIIMFAILKVGLEECQLQIPHIWRMFNLMVFLIKVGLERS